MPSFKNLRFSSRSFSRSFSLDMVFLSIESLFYLESSAWSGLQIVLFSVFRLARDMKFHASVKDFLNSKFKISVNDCISKPRVSINRIKKIFVKVI
jgi:hypothetical protein